MNRWQKFRVWCAGRLLKGSGLTLAQEQNINVVRDGLWQMRRYVRTSGSLCHPRRVMAQKKILRRLDELEVSARSIAQQ